MSTVVIRSSWSSCSGDRGDQCLDNLLHIDRLPSEGHEMCLQAELRPENSSRSERCWIMLTIHNNMALRELHIGCSARHMEVYEDQESYLETVKGEAKEYNGSHQYWHSYVCERSLENISVKFVSLQNKEKLDLTGIWLTLEQSHHTPDNSKLVNMQEVDRMLLNDQEQSGGQAMLRQLISSLPANHPSSTTQSQTNPLLPMMLQLFTQSAASQRPDATQTGTPGFVAKQLLCDETNKDKSANNESGQNSSGIGSESSNIRCHGSRLDPVESLNEKGCSESSEMDKEESVVSSSCVACSCGVNLEARLTTVMEEMEERLRAKFQQMDDYQRLMDKKFQTLENKFQYLMKENNSSHNENT